jgi:16S rRNA (uracil1498-N3)-methyltransferase
MRRFFAPPEEIHEPCVTLGADETRHLRDVLRLRPGDEVFIFDGEGREYRGNVGEIQKKQAVITISGPASPASPESPLDLTLASTVLNGERYDLIVQKAVELGVKTLIPMITVRCEAKLRDAARRVDRWRRIAMEATKQCGRATLMVVEEPATFDELISSATVEEVVMFSERDGHPFPKTIKGQKMTALVGPKGGWDDSELEAAVAAGIQVVTLGGRILRAETAAITFTSILQYRFGDLN